MLTSEPAGNVSQVALSCFTTDCLAQSYSNQSLYLNSTWPGDTLSCVVEAAPNDFLSSTLFQVCVYVMYSTVFIVALIGNGLVFFVVYTSPRMKTVTNYFIVNLAVGDILMTLFCVPFSFVSMLALRYWPFGAVMCKAVNYSQAVSVFVSAYTLLAISLDRYAAIMRPLQPRLGKAAAKLVVAAIWCGALATAAPIPIVSRLQRPSPWHEACEMDICLEQWERPEQSRQYTCALLALQFALPLGALVCTYARIAHAVWGTRAPGEAQSARDSRMQRSKRKMVKMMVTVVAVFTISWLPLNVFIVLWTAHENDMEWNTWPGMPYVWFASHWLAMSHSCYNPIIYCYMNARYRRGFKQVLCGRLCLKSKYTGRFYHKSSEGIPLSGPCEYGVTYGDPHLSSITKAFGKVENIVCNPGDNPKMVGINGSTAPRRLCKCRTTSAQNGTSSKCAGCVTNGTMRLTGPEAGNTVLLRQPRPPARALSVRLHFA